MKLALIQTKQNELYNFQEHGLLIQKRYCGCDMNTWKKYFA